MRMSGSVDRTPERTVREFCDIWEQHDYDRFAQVLAPDVVFHMIPLEPVRGLEGLVEECKKLDGLGTVRIKIANLASAGNVVFTERVDALETPERIGELPVTGVFEVRDGKIVSWRDYFDMKQALDAFGLDEVI
jgi:limonene-1,2-epoxide hydrolase